MSRRPRCRGGEIFTLKALANSSPGPGSPCGQPARGGSVGFETLGRMNALRVPRNSEGVAKVLLLASGDATPSGWRLLCGVFYLGHLLDPRVAKTQPWAGIRERFQRLALRFQCNVADARHHVHQLRTSEKEKPLIEL